MYIYICMYVYIYVCIYIYTYTCLLFLDQRFLAARNSLGNASTAGSLGKFLSCLIPTCWDIVDSNLCTTINKDFETWNQDTGC